jgi:hypothetical protein
MQTHPYAVLTAGVIGIISSALIVDTLRTAGMARAALGLGIAGVIVSAIILSGVTVAAGQARSAEKTIESNQELTAELIAVRTDITAVAHRLVAMTEVTRQLTQEVRVLSGMEKRVVPAIEERVTVAEEHVTSTLSAILRAADRQSVSLSALCVELRDQLAARRNGHHRTHHN